MAPVFRIDILDRLLASLVLEIDIDIGRLIALRRNKAVKEQRETRRIDGCDAKAITDCRVGRRAAPLAQDAAFIARISDYVRDSQEVGCIGEIGDDLQLAHQQSADFFRYPVRISLRGAFPGEVFKRGLRVWIAFDCFIRILIAELVERKADAVDESRRLRDRLRRLAIEPRHFFRGLQAALGVRRKTAAGGVECRLFTDAGEHVGERAALMPVIKRFRRRKEARGRPGCKGFQERQAPAILAIEDKARREPDIAAMRGGRGKRLAQGGVRRAAARDIGDKNSLLAF